MTITNFGPARLTISYAFTIIAGLLSVCNPDLQSGRVFGENVKPNRQSSFLTSTILSSDQERKAMGKRAGSRRGRNTLPRNSSVAETDRPKPIHCWAMKIGGDWKINGDLPDEALVISLQGLVNRSGPQLYLLYPTKGYDYTNTEAIMAFYHKYHGVDHKTIKTIPEALVKFRKYIRGYIVYDPKLRDSIVLSFTAAGIMDGVVVAPEQIPMMDSLGFKMLVDFRGKFEGMDTTQIYQWAYNHYWNRCSHKALVYLGGAEGDIMQPAIADLGVADRLFFYDLSTEPEAGTQYKLVSMLYGKMRPFSFLFGWHSYMKDTEDSYVTLASHYALRVEGLNTLPNMSFHRWIKLPPGYKFHANHSDLKNPKLEKKIYVSFIQSDGLGLGAWLRPGRGKIPYAWEVNMYWYHYAPGILEFYYHQASPNDFFIGSLSGPSYMYPKAMPPKYLPTALKMASKLMKDLDLNMFEIYDASDSLNRDLPKSIVDDYFKYIPNAIGFVNGYGPAHTFAVKDGLPFISFDYYLPPTRKVDEVVGDLKELATLNPKRPYFLCFHVREYTDVKGVIDIMRHLGPEFKIVPLDVFMKLAGMDPTFKTRYESTKQPVQLFSR